MWLKIIFQRSQHTFSHGPAACFAMCLHVLTFVCCLFVGASLFLFVCELPNFSHHLHHPNVRSQEQVCD